MKLSDWNDSIEYAKLIKYELKRKGIDVVYKGENSSFLQNGKGLKFHVLDRDGNIFKTYHTGCEEHKFALMTRIASVKERILKEC